MKRVVRSVLVVALLLLIAFLGLTLPTFIGNEPSVDGPVSGTVTLIKDGYVNAFLVTLAEGGMALVDCGNDPEGKALLSAIRGRGGKPEDVRAIFLTHGHADHTAGCHQFPSAKVFALGADVPLAQAQARGRGPVPRWIPTPPEKAVHITNTLHDGEVVQIAGTRFHVFALPGHTDGSAAYLTGDTLLLGDSAHARSGERGLKRAPWLFSDDSAQNVESLKALHARLTATGAKVKTLAFGHSGPSHDVDALLSAD